MPEQENLCLLLKLHALEKEQLKVTDELLHLHDVLTLLVINSEDSKLVRNSQKSHPFQPSGFDRKMPGHSVCRFFFSPSAPTS